MKRLLEERAVVGIEPATALPQRVRLFAMNSEAVFQNLCTHRLNVIVASPERTCIRRTTAPGQCLIVCTLVQILEEVDKDLPKFIIFAESEEVVHFTNNCEHNTVLILEPPDLDPLMKSIPSFETFSVDSRKNFNR